nr:ATP-binding protein [Oscillochloris sp. ZM17-4]
MQQVLMNLIRNAIDATESGEIEVTSARVQSKVVVQIRDTGCGIPQKNAFAIFLLNFSTKVSGSVSGVGLYAVKSLIERAGGAVFVSSACQAEANQIENWQQGTVLLNLPAWDAPGTIFQISLPCA